MFATIANQVFTFHPTEADAAAVAAANNTDSDDWSYRVEKADRGYFIAVYDENGDRLGTI